MKGSFAHVDGALIDRIFQPLVDWIGDHTTFDGFRVARICVDLAALAWILSTLGGMAETAASGTLASESVQFAMIALVLGAMSVLRALFQRTGGGPNPLRAAMHTHRAICLLWLLGLLVKTAASPPGLAAMALLTMGAFATTAFYAAACSNPPTKRRVSRKGNRRWILPAMHRGLLFVAARF
jgi:hypothetical protein